MTEARYAVSDQGDQDGADRAAEGAVEQPPAAAAEIFGPNMAGALRYAEFLADAGLHRGLIGPRERGRLWSRHLLNCAVLAEAVPPGSRVVDIGSGAGLPGIPLALAAATVTVDLVESLLRRATFLTEAVQIAGVADRCRVVRARAEEAQVGGAEVGGADVVTARAVAPLAKLARWAAPLLRPGGMLLAIKGESAVAEVARDASALRHLGLREIEVITLGGAVLDEPTTVVRATLSARPAGRRR